MPEDREPRNAAVLLGIGLLLACVALAGCVCLAAQAVSAALHAMTGAPRSKGPKQTLHSLSRY